MIEVQVADNRSIEQFQHAGSHSSSSRGHGSRDSHGSLDSHDSGSRGSGSRSSGSCGSGSRGSLKQMFVVV